ncbi:hypothetical protein OTU49_016546 [Cherax quadricarinatus]|uniref:Uncharacterized protein n=1 Tax=Cherax quadricarinatus TaxID=27406 RepID=A0AAW0XT57_CHEQU
MPQVVEGTLLGSTPFCHLHPFLLFPVALLQFVRRDSCAKKRGILYLYCPLFTAAVTSKSVQLMLHATAVQGKNSCASACSICNGGLQDRNKGVVNVLVTLIISSGLMIMFYSAQTERE